LTWKITYSNPAGNARRVDGLLPKGEIMANIYIGSDGVPIEQDDDGAFYVTEKKAEDSKKFEEIINGPSKSD
jgi:hypothetical protein